MGLLARSIALTQLRVEGVPNTPMDEIFEEIRNLIFVNRFSSIQHTVDPQSIGWVQINDTSDSSFENPGHIWIGDLICFTLRKDVRRIPAAVLREELRKDTDLWLSQNPGFRHMPKQLKEERKNLVSSLLFARTLPVPTTTDVVWNVATGSLWLLTASLSQVDLFHDMFRKTFEKLTLRNIAPFDHLERICPDVVQSANQCTTDSFLDRVNSNAWIGFDFLTWMLTRDHDATANQEAWIDKKISFIGESGEGIQKITIAGPLPERLSTIRAALADGRNITDATIHLCDNDGNQWQFCLKGSTFAMSGFKTPTIATDTSPGDDAQLEFQAMIFERVHLVSQGLGILDLFLKQFVGVRITGNWEDEQRRIASWVAREE